MKFGYFDDKNKEYVITMPQTPYPWINYLGNQEFFSLISNTAGGYSFYKDALYRRLNRYRYNNVPMDSGGRYFYIKDNDTIWSPGWKPVKTKLDFYECHHGMGYTRILSEKNNISSDILFFVPQDYHGEIQKVTLTNKSQITKKIKLFSLIEFCLWNAQDDTVNFQRNFSTGEVEVKDSVIYHKTEYRERRNHYSFYSVNAKINGYDTDRESFMGLYNGFDQPEVVMRGEARNSIADGWSPIASHFFDLTLKPGEEKTLIFILGYVENNYEDKWESPGVINKKKALRMIEQYNTVEKVDKGFKYLCEFWDNLLNRFYIDIKDEKIARMVNIWNQYQCMVTFNMARSASFFESGNGRGLGFRDTNQDLLGCIHQIPERSRQRIIDVAATQLVNGGAYHQFDPISKRGNNRAGTNFNDDPLWLILSTSAYLKETGDWKLLDQIVPFENDDTKAASLFEHLYRSFYNVANNPGPHGLPLIGRADWNDCLNLNCYSTQPDESFQTCTSKDGKIAESVMIAGMFVYIGKEFVQICRRLNKEDEAKKAQELIDKMAVTIEKYGWDGEWYLRAYDDSGEKIGSHECNEGKIFIETQGFCSMAEIGIDKNYPVKSLDSVKKYLDTKYGIVLNNPPYSKYYLNLGEISTYPPGYKENAGIFCHNNAWVIIGEAINGRGNRAFEYYQKISPAYNEEISDLHRTEPYIYAQMIAGKDARRYGEAKNSWLTGTAAWNFVAISQWILGIQPHYDGLQVNPCIPAEWDGYEIKRFFQGATYQIKVLNPSHVSTGVKSVTVDGKPFSGNILPVYNDGKTHQIEVVLGK